MTTLYIAEQGAQLRKSSERLLVSKDGETLLDTPAFQVDRILIFGNVHITTHAMNFLMEKGIDTSFLSTRGRIRGRLSSIESKNVFLRLAQYDRGRDENFKLAMAKTIIEGKLRNQKTLLLRYQRNHPDLDFSEHIGVIENCSSSISRQEKLDSIMGLEGSATFAYFKGFSKMVGQGFKFENRLRRPPPDPVNALLSLGYTMITNEIGGILEATGLDPFIGFLHGLKYGRKSLALDMVEEFRHPVVDMFTLALINRRTIKEADFSRDKEGGVRLSSKALKIYFDHYEKRMQKALLNPADSKEVPLRAVFRLQAEKLEKVLLENDIYEPFLAR